jgi:protein kinase-like protein
VKVVDFGIAAAVGQPEVDAAGMLMGTPAYVAPEQLAGGQVSAASDVYGLGLLLYRCLTGALPWPNSDPVETVRARRVLPTVALAETPGVPAALVDLCNQCLDPYPEARPSSGDLAKALARVAGRNAAPVRAAVPAPDPTWRAEPVTAVRSMPDLVTAVGPRPELVAAVGPTPTPAADAPMAASDAPMAEARRARQIRTAWSLGTLAALAVLVAIAAGPLSARLLSHPTRSPAAAALPAGTAGCAPGHGRTPAPSRGNLIGCEQPAASAPGTASRAPSGTAPTPGAATPTGGLPARVPPAPAPTTPAATTPAAGPHPGPSHPSRPPTPSHPPTPTVDPSPGDPTDSTAPAVGPDPGPSR